MKHKKQDVKENDLGFVIDEVAIRERVPSKHNLITMNQVLTYCMEHVKDIRNITDSRPTGYEFSTNPTAGWCFYISPNKFSYFTRFEINPNNTRYYLGRDRNEVYYSDPDSWNKIDNAIKIYHDFFMSKFIMKKKDAIRKL
jgi:hypothetical protein